MPTRPRRAGAHRLHLAFLCTLALGGAGAATNVGCGSSTSNDFPGGDGGLEASPGGGHETGTIPPGGKKDSGPMSLGGGDAAPVALAISPSDPHLDVPAAGTTLKFRLLAKGSSESTPASWSLDSPEIGTIDNDGLFTASGLLGGKTKITARSATTTATTTLTVKLVLTQNPGLVTTAVQQQLEAGGTIPDAAAPGPTPDAAVPPANGEVDASADPTIAGTGFQWLYPYDGTVFPRGLAAPVLQFSGPPADAVYVHITLSSVEYKGFFGPGTMGQAPMGAAVWQAITSSAVATDSVQVQLTKITAGVVTGPITEHWSIAQGTLKGTVYYNSYDSQLFPGGVANGGVLKLKPGGSAIPLIGGSTTEQCTVCHAVSSDGSTLIATHNTASAGYTAGTSYDLKNNANPIWQQGDSEFSFGGIYPDGTFTMTNGANGNPSFATPGTYAYGANSRLITTNGGTPIPAPGWDGVIANAISPAFSPDGTKIGFTHYDLDQANHTIAVMDFAASTHTFSNLVDIATDPNHYLGWPTFTPDNEWVIFHADTRTDIATWQGGDANLVIAHVPSGTTANLDVLNGYKNGVAYLPYGIDDLNHDYEPTLLPVAVGGYYWVVFTSRRNYGNTIQGMDPWDPPSGPSPRKKLWVAALDIDPSGQPSLSAHDISHPAFYLDGQELTSGNSRGFWALDPCATTGGSCSTGDECCSGFCRPGTVVDAGAPVVDAGPVVDGVAPVTDGAVVPDAGAPTGLVCVTPPKNSCSQEYEKCTTSADCCGASQGYSCINSFCAAPAGSAK